MTSSTAPTAPAAAVAVPVLLPDDDLLVLVLVVAVVVVVPKATGLGVGDGALRSTLEVLTDATPVTTPGRAETRLLSKLAPWRVARTELARAAASDAVEL